MALAEPQRGVWPASWDGQEEERGCVVFGSGLHRSECSTGGRSTQFPCSLQYGRRRDCRSDASNGEEIPVRHLLQALCPLHEACVQTINMWSNVIDSAATNNYIHYLVCKLSKTLTNANQTKVMSHQCPPTYVLLKRNTEKQVSFGV